VGRPRLLGGLIALAFVGCSGGADDGLKKYPVRGTVLVNGRPAAGIAVTFHHNGEAPGNAARPVAVADAEGRYTLSTNADKDGAVEGEYTVTFFWPADNGPMPRDRLGGRFADTGLSAFKARVGPRENEIEPFRLEIDPRLLSPATPRPVAAQ
jgi:hypothetical protein